MIPGLETIAGLGPQELSQFIHDVLLEDIGGGDITTILTIPPTARFSAVLAPREPVVLVGISIAEAFFRELDPDIEIERFYDDGAALPAGTTIMRITGKAHAMLAAERSALNSLQHLSGIATLTRRYVDAIEGTGCTLLDTRKTTPGLRIIEKYAAMMGGAKNHRMRLDDGILIKDNHIAVAGGVGEAVRAAKSSNTELQIQVEVDRVDQIETALAAGADRLLCDNMAPALLKAAVTLVSGRVPIEASGGVHLDTIREIALTGVDYISVGRITQSAPAADIGLDYTSG